MKRSIMVTTGALTVFVFASGFGGGCGRRHHEPEELQRHLERHATSHVEEVLEDLDATDGQKKAILARVGPLIQQGVALHTDHRANRAAFKAEWASERPDPARIHSRIDRFAADLTALMHAVADAALETHANLTPEQRKEALEMFDD